MHELTKLLGDKIPGWERPDRIIREWLEEKAKEIATNIHERHLEAGLPTKIVTEIEWQKQILGLKDKSLAEKIQEYRESGIWHGRMKEYTKDISKIARQHFKEHPEELEGYHKEYKWKGMDIDKKNLS